LAFRLRAELFLGKPFRNIVGFLHSSLVFFPY